MRTRRYLVTMAVLLGVLWSATVKAADIPDCCKQQKSCCQSKESCCPKGE
jgi:hypothetical protein